MISIHSSLISWILNILCTCPCCPLAYNFRICELIGYIPGALGDIVNPTSYSVRNDLRYSAALHRFRQAVSFGLVRGRYKLPGEHLLLALDPHELLDNLNSTSFTLQPILVFLFFCFSVLFLIIPPFTHHGISQSTEQCGHLRCAEATGLRRDIPTA